MAWRPDNWENPYSLVIELDPECEDKEALTRKANIFEAGADAMNAAWEKWWGALVESGIEVDLGAGIHQIGHVIFLHYWEQHVPGTIMFIEKEAH